jgi:hypothetical protein
MLSHFVVILKVRTCQSFFLLIWTHIFLRYSTTTTTYGRWPLQTSSNDSIANTTQIRWCQEIHNYEVFQVPERLHLVPQQLRHATASLMGIITRWLHSPTWGPSHISERLSVFGSQQHATSCTTINRPRHDRPSSGPATLFVFAGTRKITTWLLPCPKRPQLARHQRVMRWPTPFSSITRPLKKILLSPFHLRLPATFVTRRLLVLGFSLKTSPSLLYFAVDFRRSRLLHRTLIVCRVTTGIVVPSPFHAFLSFKSTATSLLVYSIR